MVEPVTNSPHIVPDAGCPDLMHLPRMIADFREKHQIFPACGMERLVCELPNPMDRSSQTDCDRIARAVPLDPSSLAGCPVAPFDRFSLVNSEHLVAAFFQEARLEQQFPSRDG